MMLQKISRADQIAIAERDGDTKALAAIARELLQHPPKIESRVRWYVAIAQPNWDQRVAHDLVRQGFQVYLPLTHRRERTSNRAWTETTLRLSPYIFVGLDVARANLNLKAVSDTLGFAKFVNLSPGKQFTEVPASMIDALRSDEIAEIDNASRRVRRKESSYKVDDEVEFHPHHAFAGYRGRVKELCHSGLMVDLGAFPVRCAEDDVFPIAWAKP